jgi:hypothetical protein
MSVDCRSEAGRHKQRSHTGCRRAHEYQCHGNVSVNNASIIFSGIHANVISAKAP